MTSHVHVHVQVGFAQPLYYVKGLVTSDTHVQYKSPISSGKKVMAKFKVFVHAHMLTLMWTPWLLHYLP